MVPPKDPCIQVRVLEDIGEGIVLSDDKTYNLALQSIHLLKRTDAEQFISRVKLSCTLYFIFQSSLKCHLIFSISSMSTGLNGGDHGLTC